MKNNKGFTLIEVIISIAALGIICAVLLKLFVLAGTTNEQASSTQDAELCVTSTVETLVCANTIQDGFDVLGLSFSGDGQYVSIQNDLPVTIDIKQSSAQYPGMLYDICVRVENEDELLSEIQTKKYYKEQAR